MTAASKGSAATGSRDRLPIEAWVDQNDFASSDAMRAAHKINRPGFAHAILATALSR